MGSNGLLCCMRPGCGGQGVMRTNYLNIHESFSYVECDHCSLQTKQYEVEMNARMDWNRRVLLDHPRYSYYLIKKDGDDLLQVAMVEQVQRDKSTRLFIIHMGEYDDLLDAGYKFYPVYTMPPEQPKVPNAVVQSLQYGLNAGFNREEDELVIRSWLAMQQEDDE